MKTHGSINIGNKHHARGSRIPGPFIYPFFLIHMFVFGASGFYMAYSDSAPELSFLYMHGGFAIFIYTIFYLTIFGLDEVKWMFLNALFGILGIYAQVGWLLMQFDKNISDYPLKVHVIPVLYFILYSFLVRRAVLDITGSTSDSVKRKKVESRYIVITLAINLGCFVLQWLA